MMHGNPTTPLPKDGCGEPQASEASSSPMVILTGVATKDSPGQPEGKLYILSEEPGKPAVSTELLFDEQSMCGDSMHSIVCMALNVSDYGLTPGRKIQVTGIRQGGGLQVRRLELPAE